MSGRHAKRTTVRVSWPRFAGDRPAWRVELATYDRPANPLVFTGIGARRRALNYAHDFETAKARMRNRDAAQWPMVG